MVLTRYSSDTRANKVDDRTFRFVISDESIDRYNTIIKLDAWDLTNYEKNGIVAYQHITWSSDPDVIIGQGKAWREDGVLMGEVKLEPEGDNPLADKIAKKLRNGTLSATSVGFNPLEWSRGLKEYGENPDVIYFRKVDLLEWSIVNIPANPNATIQNSYTDFLKMAFEEEQIEQTEEITPQNIEQKPDEYTGRLLKLRMNTL